MEKNNKTTALFSRLIKWHCGPRYNIWQNAIDNPAITQYRLFKEIVQACAHTRYARYHKLKKEDGIASFQSKVPIVGYHELASWLETDKNKTDCVIVPDKIIDIIDTKEGRQIPFTKKLCQSFFSLYQIWFYDIICQHCQLETGKLFIHPDLLLPELSHYNQLSIPRWAKNLLLRYSITPHALADISEPDTKLDALALLLLSEPDLEIIALNHPDALLQVLDHIYYHRQRLISILKKGRYATANFSLRFAKATPALCNMIEATPIPWTVLWPKLKLISCYASAHASLSAEQLESEFPDVIVQGKGVINVEAPLCLPIYGAAGLLPLVDEVFYEFEDEYGTVHLLHELEPQSDYNIIVSQKAGLLRYRTNEKVKVLRNYRRTPSFEYLGHSDQVSDLAGEKLYCGFVKMALEELIENNYHYLLLPNIAETRHYCIVTDNPNLCAEQIDTALCGSRHYRSARMFGRLASVKLNYVSHLRETLAQFCQLNQQPLDELLQNILVTDLSKANLLLSDIMRSFADMSQIDFID